MEYNFKLIEEKWQGEWKANDVYKVSDNSSKPKFYVLDMFPYPSGAGLHVGHPLGYIASDIYARYKRLKGFNVLHPMGFDAFGLPAEQYAIDHGIHPAISTENNIKTFRHQLDNIGFSYDWSREVRTSDPHYYKWTQWIFLQIFDSWYNRLKDKAERIRVLYEIFEKEGNVNHAFPNSKFQIPDKDSAVFTTAEWKSFDEKTKQEILMQYRLAYLAYTDVNWCEALGTVLANDEVVNGVSERGGFPVVKKKMRQWSLRITEYAERLLKGLEEIDFSESMKEIQRNWIGKSFGAEITFRLTHGPSPLQDLTPNPSPKERGTAESDSGKFSAKDSNENFGYVTNSINEWRSIIDFAKQNRGNLTEAENKLWQELRNRKFQDYKFRRQHPIAGYIPDFVCLEKKLVVEVDGGYHDEREQQKLDEARTLYLKEHGYRLIRFTNDDILKNISLVLQQLGKALSFGEGLGEVSPSPKEKGSGDEDEASLKVFTTRPDTIFGVDFMVLAPEHDLVKQITTPDHLEEVDKYLQYVQSRSDVERMAEVKKITGCFTGAYAINPLDGREIPIWISEYVLIGYGTGAIMGVPSGDERDHKFAKHFNIPITNIIGDYYNGEEANPTKDAILQNSGFLDGMVMRDAIEVVINELEELGVGKRQINYKMRDAGWSRQRYWGEPFPVVYKDGIPYAMDEKDLPLELPLLDDFKSAGTGEGPLANVRDWVNISENEKRDTNTMPTHAGAAWYFLRFMDPHNKSVFADRKILDYWNQVDVYIGGSEHAVAHLLYSRLWVKILHDLGYLGFDEPFRKLINQGKIGGDSRLVYRVGSMGSPGKTSMAITQNFPVFISYGYYKKYCDGSLSTKAFVELINENIPGGYFFVDEETDYSTIAISELHADVNIVNGLELDVEAFRKWKPDFNDAHFILEDGSVSSPTGGGGEGAGKYLCGTRLEKMSKRYFNVVNPNDVVSKYGADTFRMYEMFLGPLEASKPWDVKGIEGVHRFLKKLWRLFYDEQKGLPAGRQGKVWTEEKASEAELKVLHKAIKKIEEDTERFSFNTAVSTFMIAVNELTDLKSHKRSVLEPLLILLTPYAPHACEELWHLLGHDSYILDQPYPVFEEKYLVESSKEYPISINGKLRTTMNIALDAPQSEIEKMVMENDVVQKWVEGKSPKKIIYVKGKMVNVVV